VIDPPDSVEPLVDYFRCISGEHPDWDEYRQAMRDQGRSLLRITPESWSPVATGGFPPRLASDGGWGASLRASKPPKSGLVVSRLVAGAPRTSTTEAPEVTAT
jgi:hypothetical protein